MHDELDEGPHAPWPPLQQACRHEVVHPDRGDRHPGDRLLDPLPEGQQLDQDVDGGGGLEPAQVQGKVAAEVVGAAAGAHCFAHAPAQETVGDQHLAQACQIRGLGDERTHARARMAQRRRPSPPAFRG